MGFIIKKPDGEAGKALPAIVIGVFVAFGGILFGYVTSTLFHNSNSPALNVVGGDR